VGGRWAARSGGPWPPLPRSRPGKPKGAAPATPPAETRGPRPSRRAIIGDLHWLDSFRGHVIEFANGMLENGEESR